MEKQPKKRPRGRPFLGEDGKIERIYIRISRAEKAQLLEAAGAAEETLSDWLRRQALRQAKKATRRPLRRG